MEFQAGTLPNVLCCMCGTVIPSNPANMCVSCIRSRVDITEGIPKQLNIFFCKTCGRYLQPPKNWVTAQLESKELLALCIKKVRGLNKVKLVDAGFIWTEPHSRRIKLKLTIQKEVFSGAILQQVFVVEFVVENQQCDQCQAVLSEKTWKAVVQVRQKVDHKRTFFYLEQLILKHHAHEHTVNIKEAHEGVDFFFGGRSHALKFVDFLQSVVPVRFKTSDHLVSHDANSNTYNYQYSFSVEICPVCKDDLIVLPPKIAASMGNCGPLMLCTRVSTGIQIIDPMTLQTIDIGSQVYWKNTAFRSLLSAKAMVSYTVLDVEPVYGSRFRSNKYALADVQVAKTSELGRTDSISSVRTHLGNLLKPGDLALGYDLKNSNHNDAEILEYKGLFLPDVVLLKKDYGPRRKKQRNRPWKLKQLDKADAEAPLRKTDDAKQSSDYEHFLRELEEDPELRSTINLYRDPNYVEPASAAVSEMGDEDEAAPTVGLEELLDEMTLDDASAGPDPDDDDGDQSMGS